VKTLVYPGDTLAALVAEARWREQARPQESLEDVVAWLEEQKRKAEELRFSYLIRNEPLKAAYEEGRLEVINAVLNKLRRPGRATISKEVV